MCLGFVCYFQGTSSMQHACVQLSDSSDSPSHQVTSQASLFWGIGRVLSCSHNRILHMYTHPFSPMAPIFRIPFGFHACAAVARRAVQLSFLIGSSSTVWSPKRLVSICDSCLLVPGTPRPFELPAPLALPFYLSTSFYPTFLRLPGGANFSHQAPPPCRGWVYVFSGSIYI